MSFLILWWLAVLGAVCIFGSIILGVIIGASTKKIPKLEKITVGLLISGAVIAFLYLMVLITQFEIVL